MGKIIEPLQLKFDPRTIEHLGIKMYSRLPYALAELVANAYDADASNVSINLYDADPNDRKIVISDDGEGMSYEEARDNFLVIGRKRRDIDENRTTNKGRRITGKKGLGKLALFGIGKNIRVETSKAGDIEETIFVMDWDKIINESSGIYYPSEEQVKKINANEKGTKIILSKLSRMTDFDLKPLAVSLSKLFNCFDSNFEVRISRNDKENIVVTREMKYESIDKEFEWNVSDIVNKINEDYDYKSQLKGTIISSKKPMKQDLRGITIYANGRLANLPSFFGASEAGHVFSYITGWIDADFLDEFDQDLISTDRQSISWDLPEATALHNYLQNIIKFLVKDWGAKRKIAKENNQTKKTGIDIGSWYKTVPDAIRPQLEKVINKIENKSEIDDTDFIDVVNDIHKLIPPYTFYHYRLLHDQVKQSAGEYYEEKKYYTAFQEAMKRYKNIVKEKTGTSQVNDRSIVEEAFGKNGKLSTTAKFQLRPNGQPFSAQTLANIEEGQQYLSIGAVVGGRNVLSHEEIKDLTISKLFTEKDCLDLLSLISYLFKRLDESEKK